MTYLESCNFDFIDLLPFAERPFRAKFIPSKVWKELDRYINDSKGLQNYCKKWRTSVKFLKQKSKAKLWTDYIAVGGEYWERRNTVLIYNSSFDTFEFNEDSWERFKYKFMQTIMHELIHFMQYDRRFEEPCYYHYPHKKTGNKRTDEDREYYCSTDEIQAYAHCIFLDFKRAAPKEELSNLLKHSKEHQCKSQTLKTIYKTFNYDFNNHNLFINRLYKEVLRWDEKYAKFIA